MAGHIKTKDDVIGRLEAALEENDTEILWIDNTCNTYYAFIMTFQEIERIIKKDGWRFSSSNGSHYHYKHGVKPGKVTIPHPQGNLPKRVINSIFKQAGLK
jgi:predicted RNA binding protein YcfA (HicA-like mRNA interferase family)